MLLAHFIFLLPTFVPGATVQDVKVDSPTLTLEQLGLSVGWGECQNALSGTKAVFQFRSRSREAESVEGVLVITWGLTAIRIERLEHHLGKEDNVFHEVEEFYPLRGEYVGYHSRPGWADSAFIATMQTPPPLAATLLGLMNPRFHRAELQISKQASGFAMSGQSEDSSIQIEVADSDTAIPALWTIASPYNTERILYSTPLRDPETGRTVPGLIVRQEVANGTVREETIWLRVLATEMDAARAIRRRALVSDLRTPGSQGVVVMDREVPLESLADWLGGGIWAAPNAKISSPLPIGEVVKGRKYLASRGTGEHAKPSARAVPPEEIGADLLKSAAVSLGFARSGSSITRPLLQVAGLPVVVGVPITPWELLPLDNYDDDLSTAQGSASGRSTATAVTAAIGQKPESRRVITNPVALILEQDRSDLTARGHIVMSAFPGGKPFQLISSKSQCGVDLMDLLPIDIGEKPTTLSFERRLSTLLPAVEHELVTLVFSDGSERRIAVRFRSEHGAAVDFIPGVVSLSNGESGVVSAYSTEYSIVAWKWGATPPCLARAEGSSNEGEHSWVFVGTEAQTKRHKCGPLVADISIIPASGELAGHELSLKVQLPIAHPPQLRNSDGAMIRAGIFQRGERVALIKSADNNWTLWCPDRIVQRPDQLLMDVEEIYITRIPQDQLSGPITWCPNSTIGVMVNGAVSTELGDAASQWMHAQKAY